MVALMIVALFLSEMAQAIVGGVPVPQGSEEKTIPANSIPWPLSPLPVITIVLFVQALLLVKTSF